MFSLRSLQRKRLSIYWLIRLFEGDATLADLMQSRQFPYNVESHIFNIIDLGAATDLRVGINCIPKEFLLDPRSPYVVTHGPEDVTDAAVIAVTMPL
ncbi:hypothetical protein JHK87_049433 [Glycine soja]|nr:hypothetical protein JHK87_049433 [Glycine soja]